MLIDDIRDLDLPHWLSHKITYLEPSRRSALRDARSHLTGLGPVDEATVLAAELAYDVEDIVGDDGRSQAHLSQAAVDGALSGYDVVATFADTLSGFKAAAFASQGTRDRHRIYAIAGTQVFENRDYRDWASGLRMASPQFVSDAALTMIRHAADYASDMERGGEVVVTGQSQGALGAQGLGFLLQEDLNARGTPHHLVHVVSWGAAGAHSEIVAVIEQYRRDGSRGVWPPLERHLAFTQPDYPEIMAIWHAIGSQWLTLDDAAIDAHVHSVAAQMRIVGFFFEIDPFARAGEFLGTPFVFPTELMLPDRCDNLVLELLFRTRIGKLGVTLESHFLNGYRRAAARGAIELSRPAEPEKWPWVMDTLADVRGVGRMWLADLFLAQVGTSETNWQTCRQAGAWMTEDNRRCRDASWPGCSRLGDDDDGEGVRTRDVPRWCLITRDRPDPQSEAIASALPQR